VWLCGFRAPKQSNRAKSGTIELDKNSKSRKTAT
jgi:hypothetical protein